MRTKRALAAGLLVAAGLVARAPFSSALPGTPGRGAGGEGRVAEGAAPSLPTPLPRFGGKGRKEAALLPRTGGEGGKGGDVGHPVSVEIHKDRIDFRSGKELAASYVIGPEVAKPYFWPLRAPGGLGVTRSWPMEKLERGEAFDHPHQKSAWFCHGDVIPEGMELKARPRGIEGVDFWDELPGHGVIVCTRVDRPARKGGGVRVVTTNEWRTADGVKVLDETRAITFHDFGGSRLWVLDIDLLASVAPLTFGDTKEGSLGVRVRQGVTEEKGQGRLTNADGKSGEKGPGGVWGRLSAWCDYSGPVGDRAVGVAILADPGNPLPSCWHSRGYGLMAANPFGRAKSGFPAMKGRTDRFRLAKGEHLKLRYGLLLHAGDVKDGKVAEYYDRFLKLND